MPITAQSASRTTVIMGTLTVGSVFLGSLYPCELPGKTKEKDTRPTCGQLPGLRPLVGALFAFAIISALSNPAPEMATGFALAVGTVAYLTYASPVVNAYFSTGPNLTSSNNPIADALAKRAQGGK